MNEQRVILDAALERSVIRGTLTAAEGERRAFHGWLELHTALEAMLATVPDQTPHTCSAPQPHTTPQQANNGPA
jgi:hypothetical protein